MLMGFVSRAPIMMILGSPNKTTGKTAQFFNFCFTTETERYKGISFSKQHHQQLSSVNNSKTKGVQISNAEITEKEIKLTANTIIKIVDIEKQYNPALPLSASIEHILQLPVKSWVTILCKVVSHTSIPRTRCTVHNYEVVDATGTITIVSFETLPLQEEKYYNVTNLNVDMFSNDRRLKWEVNSHVTPATVQSFGNIDQVKYKVNIASVTKGKLLSKHCEKCFEEIKATEDLFICSCGHVSSSCKETMSDGTMIVVHENGEKQELTFTDPAIFNEIGKLESFSVKEYKVLMTSKFNIVVNGASVVSMATIKNEDNGKKKK